MSATAMMLQHRYGGARPFSRSQRYGEEAVAVNPAKAAAQRFIEQVNTHFSENGEAEVFGPFEVTHLGWSSDRLPVAEYNVVVVDTAGLIEVLMRIGKLSASATVDVKVSRTQAHGQWIFSFTGSS